MSCFACSKKYGFFTKEVGCPNCGFSFCTKCLKKEIEVPKCRNEIRKVCLSCFEKLRKQATNKDRADIKGAQSASILDQDTPIVEMAPEPTESNDIPELDNEIRKRLAAIKEPLQPVKVNELQSDEDIAKRIADLKGVPLRENDAKKILNKVDTRTDEEKTHDLIKQFVEESEIDQVAGPSNDSEDPIKDIEKRLAKLKGTTPTDGTQKPVNIEHVSEEKMAEDIVKKYLEEAKLPDFDLGPEEKEYLESVKQSEKKDKEEELPWCTICNEDATIRCLSCDGDLFCSGCFKEIHANDEEYREHQTKRYVAPVKQTEL